MKLIHEGREEHDRRSDAALEFVIDASLLVQALRTPGPARERIADRSAAAPHLIDLEVTSAFRDLVAAGKLEPEEARAFLQVDARLELTRYPHVGLVDRIWDSVTT